MGTAEVIFDYLAEIYHRHAITCFFFLDSRCSLLTVYPPLSFLGGRVLPARVGHSGHERRSLVRIRYVFERSLFDPRRLQSHLRTLLPHARRIAKGLSSLSARTLLVTKSEGTLCSACCHPLTF